MKKAWKRPKNDPKICHFFPTTSGVFLIKIRLSPPAGCSSPNNEYFLHSDSSEHCFSRLHRCFGLNFTPHPLSPLLLGVFFRPSTPTRAEWPKIGCLVGKRGGVLGGYPPLNRGGGTPPPPSERGGYPPLLRGGFPPQTPLLLLNIPPK